MNVLQFPSPTQKIEDRIEALKRLLAHMTAVNTLLACGEIEGLRKIGYDDDQIAFLQTPDSLGCRGFSIRTFEEIEEKIERLRRGVEVPAVTEAPGWDGRATNAVQD